MISGIYIADTQGEILIERTYNLAHSSEQIKKLICSQLSASNPDNVAATTAQNEIVWEVDGIFIFAVRKGRVLYLAVTQGDAFIPEVYEVLHKLEAVLEAALVEITLERIKDNNTEILIVFRLIQFTSNRCWNI